MRIFLTMAAVGSVAGLLLGAAPSPAAAAGAPVKNIVLVHGAFNELWGPHELKARWSPAVRDGLWHHDLSIADDDIAVAFYGDLFRRRPAQAADESYQQTRAGVAEMLHNLGGDTIEALGQAANDAVFDRTVDLVATFASEPDLRDQLQQRIVDTISVDTRVVVAHSLGRKLTRSRGRTVTAVWPSAKR